MAGKKQAIVQDPVDIRLSSHCIFASNLDEVLHVEMDSGKAILDEPSKILNPSEKKPSRPGADLGFSRGGRGGGGGCGFFRSTRKN